MRRFHSYGPINGKKHFFVNRDELIKKCTDQLTDDLDTGGHYYTIWSPRQTGKTWIIRQCVEKIQKQYGDAFTVKDLSMQSFALKNDDKDVNDVFFSTWRNAIKSKFNLDLGEINAWQDWLTLFEKNSGLLKKPLILLIDEFDKLPATIIDNVVSMFRHIYLSRDEYMLHGLALVGVRAVLGVDSKKGSPFNVQRSVHIPNLTLEEVQKMFDDYQNESGQMVDPDVVQLLYKCTNGQPGLIGWFGELLTEKYNPNPTKTIDIKQWKKIYKRSINIEHNNTLQNMIIKAKNEYKEYIFQLFKESNITFTFSASWCNYMYMNGLISYTEIETEDDINHICRFSSPYVQDILYTVFVKEIQTRHNRNILPLDPTDCLEDVFQDSSLNMPVLLKRYNDFLKRLKDSGKNPWDDQPRRKTDYHLTEAVGHFHLYFWLKMVLDDICTIVPEFPTGNGKVDLHIKCDQNKKALIEVKSFVSQLKVKKAMIQASEYAADTSYSEITIAMFAPFNDENVLNQISTSQTINNINVNVVAIGQG